MIIHPEVLVTPDFPTVKFREPKEQIDLEKELPKVLQSQGWGCGTYFNVQFLNHQRTHLLSSALYVVTEETEGLHTTESAYQPITKVVYTRKAERIGPWWEASEDKPKGAAITWNPGKKLHQVRIGEEVIFESSDKAEAQAVASGKAAA